MPFMSAKLFSALSLYLIGYPKKIHADFFRGLLRQGYAFSRNDDIGFRLPEKYLIYCNHYVFLLSHRFGIANAIPLNEQYPLVV